MAQAKNKRHREKPHTKGCCMPRALLWIDGDSSQLYVENRIQQHTRFDVRAANAQTTTPAPARGMVQNATSDSELDQTVMKDQGKVYRTDRYTVHWKAEGQCQPLEVRLKVTGAIQYNADCLPGEGQVTLSRSYLLEPPAYAPLGAPNLVAWLNVTDCSGLSAECQNEVPRP